MEQNEKRAFPRFGVNGEFDVLDGMFNEYVANLSHGGSFLRCDESLPVGTRVQLKFTILLDDIETIEGIGEVVRHQSNGEPGLGIRFVELTERSQEVVNIVCHNQQFVEEF